MKRNRVLLAGTLLLATAWTVYADDAPAPEPEKVSFVTEDGVKIVGDFYAAEPLGDQKPPLIIFLHMYKSDRSAWRPIMDKLLKAHMSGLAIDMRGHGESTEIVGAEDGGETATGDLAARVEERDKDVFEDMFNDVAAAYTWAAKDDRVDLSRFGIVGASVGCTVALAYAAKDSSVDAILCLSPGEKYMGIRSTTDIKRLEGRKILLVTNPEERPDADALKKANESAEVTVKIGRDGERDLHGTRMFGAVDDIEDVVVSFLQGAVGGGTRAEDQVITKLGGKTFFPSDHRLASRLDVSDRRVLSDSDEATARGLRQIGGGKKTMAAPSGMAP